MSIWAISSMWGWFAQNDGVFARCSVAGPSASEPEHLDSLANHMLQMLKISISGLIEHLGKAVQRVIPIATFFHLTHR